MEFIKKNANRIYIGIAVCAIVIAAVLGIDYGVGKSASATETAETVTAKTEKEKRDKVLISVNTETIREGLSNMGLLITQEYYFTQVEKYTKEMKIFYFIPSLSEFMYSYDGAVMAGVDLTNATIQTDEDKKKIIVDLPESEIQSVTIDKSTFKIYSEQESLWNPLKLEDYNISLVEFEETAKQKALDSGIIERSDKQARSIVMEFIGSLPNTTGYTVVFK